ncbi:MAG TPA: 5'-3' exonuclease H3TH domain-containing protein, partial [Thermoanaerobaculia bacterium]
FYGLRRFNKGKDAPFGAVVGVLRTVLQMAEDGATHVGVATDHVIESFRNELWPGYKTGAGIEPALWRQFHPLEHALEAMGVTVWAMVEQGATHIGVATDHVIESFRNELWPGYKTGQGIDPALWRQFHPLEDALAAMGVVVWPMTDLEADDALASAACAAARDPRVEKVCIWTPDKDLAQCVDGTRVVQIDRRSGVIRDADGVRAKFGVAPAHIPDYLALVGDAADGFPGIRGYGAKTSARVINQYGAIEQFPPHLLGERTAEALLFKRLATLRCDADLFADVDDLRWSGPTAAFAAVAETIDRRLLTRAAACAP